MSYRVKTTRSTLAMYLAWEFGTQRAVQIMATIPSRGLVYVPASAMFGLNKRKREAQGVATRVLVAAAYQAGRIGKPLKSDVWIEAA
jgi:hypothetical protein